MSKPVKKEPCPRCRSEGSDLSGDNLARYEDGSAYCFKCKYSERKEVPVTSKLTASEIHTYPLVDFDMRGLPASAYQDMGVRVRYDTSTGEPAALYYPYISGYKVRTLPKTFSVSGKVDTLFGQDKLSGSGFLAICEGEEDAIALRYFFTRIGRECDVVSLPNGVNSVDKLFAQFDKIRGYSRFYIVMDNDEPGQEAARKIGDWLLSDAKTVLNVTLEGYKDVSEAIQSSDYDAIKKGIKHAKVVEIEGIVAFRDLDRRRLTAGIEFGYDLPFPILNDKLKGLRKGEILTVCAGSGIGKSTVTSQIAYSLLKSGHKVAKLDLEDTTEVSAQRLVALHMGVPLYQLRYKLSVGEPDFLTRFNAACDELERMDILLSGFAGMTTANLLDKLRAIAKSGRADFIFLDHLSIVVSNSLGSERDERQAIDRVMTELAKLVTETGVGLVCIVHLKRKSAEGKSYNKGGEVELSDLRGSAALEQLSWSVISVERDQQGESKDFSRLRVLKNRTCGFTGEADLLKFNHETGYLDPVVLEDPDPLGELEAMTDEER